MDLGIKRVVKNKAIRNFIVKQVQLTETLYAVLVFEDGTELPKYSSCTEISKTGLNRIISGERKLLNKIYKDVIQKLILEDYTFLNV